MVYQDSKITSKIQVKIEARKLEKYLHFGLKCCILRRNQLYPVFRLSVVSDRTLLFKTTLVNKKFSWRIVLVDYSKRFFFKRNRLRTERYETQIY